MKKLVLCINIQLQNGLVKGDLLGSACLALMLNWELLIVIKTAKEKNLQLYCQKMTQRMISWSAKAFYFLNSVEMCVKWSENWVLAVSFECAIKNLLCEKEWIDMICPWRSVTHYLEKQGWVTTSFFSDWSSHFNTVQNGNSQTCWWTKNKVCLYCPTLWFFISKWNPFLISCW